MNWIIAYKRFMVVGSLVNDQRTKDLMTIDPGRSILDKFVILKQNAPFLYH